MGTGGYDVGIGLGIRCNDWVGSFVKIPFDHLKDVAGFAMIPSFSSLRSTILNRFPCETF